MTPKKKEPTPIHCPDCKGTGIREIERASDLMSPDNRGEKSWELCKTCNGSGRVGKK